MKLEFERVEVNIGGGYASRARVENGWLYMFASSHGETSCFVPDAPQANAYGEVGAEQIAGALNRAGLGRR